MSCLRRHGTRGVPQLAPLPGSGRVPRRSTDRKMLDVVGSDTATHQLIAQFARGVP